MNERRDSSSLCGVRLRVRCLQTSVGGHVASPSTSADGVHFSLSKHTSRPVRCRSKRRSGAPLSFPHGVATGPLTDADRPSDGIINETRTRSNASGPTQVNVVSYVHRPSADVGAARLLSPPCSLGQCASPSAMIQFRALAGPVLKHGPRSLACMRVIEIIE